MCMSVCIDINIHYVRSEIVRECWQCQVLFDGSGLQLCQTLGSLNVPLKKKTQALLECHPALLRERSSVILLSLSLTNHKGAALVCLFGPHVRTIFSSWYSSRGCYSLMKAVNNRATNCKLGDVLTHSCVNRKGWRRGLFVWILTCSSSTLEPTQPQCFSKSVVYILRFLNFHNNLVSFWMWPCVRVDSCISKTSQEGWISLFLVSLEVFSLGQYEGMFR